MAVPTWLSNYRKWRKEAAQRILGGRCAECGTTTGLQFDHKRREGKSNNIATMIRSHSWGDILEELSKCQLLCQEHHREKTGRELRVETHGRIRQYRRGCRCTACSTKYKDANQKYKRAWMHRQRLAKSCSPGVTGCIADS